MTRLYFEWNRLWYPIFWFFMVLELSFHFIPCNLKSLNFVSMRWLTFPLPTKLVWDIQIPLTILPKMGFSPCPFKIYHVFEQFLDIKEWSQPVHGELNTISISGIPRWKTKVKLPGPFPLVLRYEIFWSKRIIYRYFYLFFFCFHETIEINSTGKTGM